MCSDFSLIKDCAVYCIVGTEVLSCRGTEVRYCQVEGLRYCHVERIMNVVLYSIV